MAKPSVADNPVALKARLYSRVAVDPTTACILWMGLRNPQGYGRLGIRQKTFSTHRLAWSLAFGEIPDGLCVCHKCDTPACINPAHLFLGTSADNNRDCSAKGRHATGERHGWYTKPQSRPYGSTNGTHTKPWTRSYGDKNWTRRFPEKVLRGEKVGTSKISDRDVALLREVCKFLTVSEMETMFGIKHSQIYNITHGKSRLSK